MTLHLQRLAKSSPKVVKKSGGVEVDGYTKVAQKRYGKSIAKAE